MSTIDEHETICTHEGPCVFMTAVKIAMPDEWSTWPAQQRMDWALGTVAMIVLDQYEDVAKARGEVPTDASRAAFMTKMGGEIRGAALSMAALPDDATRPLAGPGGYQQ